MNSSSQGKPTSATPKPVYRTLDEWALGILMEQRAVADCDDYGHRRDGSDPDAWTEPGKRRVAAEPWRSATKMCMPTTVMIVKDQWLRAIAWLAA